jgi:hypothetical protein
LQLVIGNNIHAKRGWTGRVHGLAILKEAVPADLAMRHHDRWAAGKNFDYLKASDRLLLYTFEEKSDPSSLIHREATIRLRCPCI